MRDEHSVPKDILLYYYEIRLILGVSVVGILVVPPSRGQGWIVTRGVLNTWC